MEYFNLYIKQNAAINITALPGGVSSVDEEDIRDEVKGLNMSRNPH